MTTSTQQELKQPLITKTLIIRALLGGFIALGLIAFFLITADYRDPSWSEYWMLRPLIVTPLAGAAGGVFFHLMDFLRRGSVWNRLAANIIGIIGFVIALWLGSVLGLAGTYWN